MIFRFFISLLIVTGLLFGCAAPETGDPELTKNVRVELVDWHVSGFWVINCPVAWVRVTNYNNVPVKEVEIIYRTYDYLGNKLNEGTYMLEGTIEPHGMKNFIEQYVGLVDLQSEQLSVHLKSVSSAAGTGGGGGGSGE